MAERRQTKQWTLPVLTAVCLLSLAVMAFVLAGGASPQETFTPPPFEEAAVAGVPDVPEGLGWQEVDAQAFRVSVCGVVVLEGDRADVWLENPASNAVWLKLRVLDADGAILGETGLIRPGEYVQSLVFDTVPAPGAAISMKVMAYEPETYHSGGTVTLNTAVQAGG